VYKDVPNDVPTYLEFLYLVLFNVLQNQSLTQNKIKDSKQREKTTRKAPKFFLPAYLYQARVQSK
jgi:hypothetical protein